jgi:hypothetical protein
MKRLLIAALWPGMVMANQCVLQDRIVTAASVTIQERSGIQQHVVLVPQGGKRCIVSFRARVDATWYTAYGQYDWAGDRPSSEACAVAVTRADESVQQQAVPNHVRTEKIMTCSDRSDLSELRQTHPGSIGKAHQFRPHPDFPRRFWHNGAQCRWFVEPALRNGDIYQYQGVVCQVQDNNWVVVDKF